MLDKKENGLQKADAEKADTTEKKITGRKAPAKKEAPAVDCVCPPEAAPCFGDGGIFDEVQEVSDAGKRGFVGQTYLRKKHKRKRKKEVNLDITRAERYNPSPENGLSYTQVEMREAQGFVNVPPKSTGKTYGTIFFTNIFTLVNLITFAVAAALIVSLVIADDRTINPLQFLFVAIILINTGIGIFLEIRAKRKIDKLTLVSAPSATVVREGQRKTIPVCEIVLDDVTYVDMGRQISADSIVLSGSCEVNESMLTGESEPVKKALGDILYSGSYLTSGACHARVDKTGANNYIEKLASHVKTYKKPVSELQNSIRLIMRVVMGFIVPISAIMLIMGFRGTAGLPFAYRLYSVVQPWSGAIIGMLPTGMFLLTSVALAIGMIRLSQKQALVQDLYCIEMLARADVLCLDKTGTLTDGSMQVNKVVNLLKEDDASAKVAAIIGSMLTATEDNNQTALALAGYFGYNAQYRPLKIQPFSSQRKFSAVSFEGEDTYILGAPEFVIKEMGIRLDTLVGEYAAQGYRVLCLAQASGCMSQEGKISSQRKAIALIVIEDYIREDAVETIKWFKENDVKIKIISGDNPVTVAEVARRVGVDMSETYVSLDGMSDQEVIEAAEKYTVFGRVSPEQKALLVKSIQSKGHTVAMTGDGVNDILAMREADCSIAIASGTEAARNVAHLVLMDSRFSSMPSVVMEGRRVINNITKTSSLFLIKTFMSIVLSLIYLLLPDPYPFLTSNLVLLELFVIGIPSFFLALQPNFGRIKGHFLTNVTGRAIPGGLALVISVMAVYTYGSIVNEGFYGQIVSGAVNISPEMLISLQVMALSLTGMVVLIKICEPLNAYRGFVLMGSLAGMIVGISVRRFGHSLGVVPLELTQIEMFMHLLFLLAVVLSAYFITTVIMRVLRVLKVME